MAYKPRDGWHFICNYEVWVEDGFIRRGIGGSGLSIKPIYVYRWSKQLRCWVKESSITIPAFRAGVQRETIKMF